MQKVINGVGLRKLFLSGAKMVEVKRQVIDALNVFPVPDGDTGTNMSLTLQAAVKELAQQSGNEISAVAEAISKGALKGARGNSGVITSQILRGLCDVFKDCGEIDCKSFVKALKRGVEVSYKAVSKPKEGTMLTVIRVIAEKAPQGAKDMDSFLSEVIRVGEDILAQTPEMLDVLKKAGVVDAGGKGLIYFFKGMLCGLRGEEIAPGEEDHSASDAGPTIDVAEPMVSYEDLGDIEFAYCTEFFVTHLMKKTTQADIERLREKLMAIGDSVLVVGDLEFVKVHVHTNRPGQALTYALQLGEVDRIKIENMLEQNRQLKKLYEAQKKEQGMLAICSGEGLSAIFKDLTVDVILEGGQTMNPSAEDIAAAVRKVNASHIFIFPNNKNIILAAEQAKALVEGKVLHVIPTKSIPQGISSVLMFNPEATVEENKVNMSNAIENVESGSVTYAVRSTSVDGLDLNEGDIIGLNNKHILTKGSNVDDVTLALIEKLKKPTSEMISLYYGAEVSEEQASALCIRVAEAFPECEVDVHMGGQPIYYYIVSVE
ncbi:MAG: DAK2 domain-containing protein [Clostridia bacterium]|nr:DAK2 domain-containing protein [Clostridia bacterium]